MGEIIYKTMIRLGSTIIILWLIKDYFDFSYYMVLSLLSLYFFVFHQSFLSYKKFEQTNRGIISNTLCSSCKQFDESAILCMKYDKHPSENFIPCEGLDWEPKQN